MDLRRLTAAGWGVGDDAYGRTVMLDFARRLDGGEVFTIRAVSASVDDMVGGLTAENLKEIARIAAGGVDYKKLLEWYLGHVYSSDGSTYLHNAIPDEFAAEEKAELERIGDAAVEAQRAHYAGLRRGEPVYEVLYGSEVLVDEAGNELVAATALYVSGQQFTLGDRTFDVVKTGTFETAEVVLRARAVVGSVQIKIFSGEAPPKCEDADPDRLLATITHYDVSATPETPNQLVLHSGSWDIADAGMAGFFRKYSVYPGGGQCDMQGSVSGPGGGGDLVLPSAVIGEERSGEG